MTVTPGTVMAYCRYCQRETSHWTENQCCRKCGTKFTNGIWE